MGKLKTVGVREFRDHATTYLSGSGPVAVSKHGRVVGFYIPVVADASSLVAELLRTRGRELLTHPDLRVVVAEEQWDESQHELQRRIGAIVEQGRLTVDHAKRLYDEVLALIDERVIEILPRRLYEHMEAVARRRVSRDPHDWPPVGRWDVAAVAGSAEGAVPERAG